MGANEIETARQQAYSIENMAGHEAAGRPTTYIGSQQEGSRIHDYYRDNVGAYWYKTRIILSSGQIVSEEVAIFGREIRKGERRTWKT